jgi:hypothetical protein
VSKFRINFSNPVIFGGLFGGLPYRVDANNTRVAGGAVDTWAPKTAWEQYFLIYDFVDELGSLDVSTASVKIYEWDVSAQARSTEQTASMIDATVQQIRGTQVCFFIQGGTAGTVYIVEIEITAVDGDTTYRYEGQGYIDVKEIVASEQIEKTAYEAYYLDFDFGKDIDTVPIDTTAVTIKAYSGGAVTGDHLTAMIDDAQEVTSGYHVYPWVMAGSAGNYLLTVQISGEYRELTYKYELQVFILVKD